ncbi:MAG: hypothetical protein EZS28_024593 [Streblomastix strix]|uniref:Uncharacterized protein n=2 Tax=Streblomastix strix TaxID=222440 RepID=A0A5J4VBQ1_9EUKA|nr:MAG: hypothetical protein EZS28_024593 [Streblomastix strix]
MNRDKQIIQTQQPETPTQKPIHRSGGTVGQLTGSQPSPIAESPGLNAEQKLKETGLISASNRERTDSQINEGHQDNIEEEEDEQTDEGALIQNKDYRVNVVSQPPVQKESVLSLLLADINPVSLSFCSAFKPGLSAIGLGYEPVNCPTVP